nr:type VI secretion system lipoprotein TssJ [uncultured Desulfobulbus sp.]
MTIFPRKQYTIFFKEAQQRLRTVCASPCCLLALFLLIPLLLPACSGSSPEPQPDWSLAENGVRLTFRADKRVNFYDGQAHSVAVAVYQLAEPNGFSQLITYPAGVQQILIASKELPPSLASDQFFLQPGETVEKVYDRAEGAKWLILAAGLYTASPQQTALLAKIPFEVERSWLTFSKTAVIPPYFKTVLLTTNELKLETSPE